MELISDIFIKYPIIFSLAILLFLLIIGRICHVIFENWLRKVAGKTKTKLDDELLEVLSGPIYWSIILSGIYFAMLPLSLSQALLILYRNIILSSLLIIWGIAVNKGFHVLLAEIESIQDSKHEEAVNDFIPFLDNIVKLLIVGVIIFIALSVWGINITPLFLSAGVAGVAVAFAAKDTVANLFGGLSVFIDRPYKIGDYVLVNDKYRGEVIEIGMRSTKIKTRDNILLTIPNSVMVTNVVINETGFDPKLRIRISLDVSYDSDLEEVEKVLIEEAIAHDKILDKPKPRVRFRKFSESAIELEVLGTISQPSMKGAVTHELIKAIHKRLQKEKIKSPFPQMDVHFYNRET